MNPLVTISSIQQRMAEGIPIGRGDEPTVRRLWWAALETLQEDILLPMNLKKGLWFAAPLPALYQPQLLDRFKVKQASGKTVLLRHKTLAEV